MEQTGKVVGTRTKLLNGSRKHLLEVELDHLDPLLLKWQGVSVLVKRIIK